ncbi:flagellar hook-associated protein FlgK [Sporomusa malonica]|uniref:Flagellar hook-associated protein 1 n=1 Tax=Sporomusa malonica TaxID=112901 RepID=A0A1W2DFE8_9FIRM|nr:flagellar hook-associated protein FlgK [Sporomusa malonica]SMC96165.1 flagellar hook-associated protein 1 FlgK [Sporomusa malonica]
MGSFFGLYNVAVSGMYVNQAGLASTSHNISNVNTTGFTRQRITGEEWNIPQMGKTSTGKGVGVAEIRQLRNQFLDQTYRRQNANVEYWQQKSASLAQMGQTLGDFVSDDGSKKAGLQQSLQSFANGWDEIKKHPDSQSARSALRGYGVALIDTFTHIDQQLKQLQQDACNRLQDSVEQLNDMAKNVAQLNTAILQTELGGAEACDLRDQRNLLLDQMSGMADISVTEQANNLVTVSIGGVSLINGDQVHSLQAVGDGSAQRPLKVQWVEANEDVALSNGSMLGLIQDADQGMVKALDPVNIPFDFKPGTTNSISDLRQGLNDMLTTVVAKINALHKSGFGLDGSTGVDFFVAADPAKPLSISNVKVNPVLDDLNKIAASASAGDLPGGCTTAESIYKMLTEEKCFKYDGTSLDLNSFYQAMVSWLGTTGEHANGAADTQDKLVQQIDSQRQSVASVSIDEETAAMIQYQRIYSANAKVLNTIDSLLGDLIRELG